MLAGGSTYLHNSFKERRSYNDRIVANLDAGEFFIGYPNAICNA